MKSDALRRFCVTLPLVTLLFSSVFLAAQATSGVTGVVTDESGALLVGARVTLTNPATGISTTTTTGSDGAYKFLHVLPATYTLTFAKEKFQSVRIANVELGVGVIETRNAKLAVGTESQTIEVTASGEGSLNTVDSSIGNVITTQQVQDLPSLFRDDASALLQLQPGVQSTSNNQQDSQYGSVTGSRADTGTITLDGLDVNDETIGSPFQAIGRAPIDSVAEVRTIVGGADASFGRGAGAQVDEVTKSGTNDWHGTLSEFNRVEAEAANDFFNNLSGVPRAQLTRNQFGGSLGGPILKDKLFFFFTYAGLRQAHEVQDTVTVPMTAFRNGELSYVSDNGPNGIGPIETLPALGAPLSQTVQGLDPQNVGADQAFLSFVKARPYPEPNDFALGDGINTAGYLFNAPAYLNTNTYVGRLDYTLSSRQTLFARGTWDRDNGTETPKAFPTDSGPVGFFLSHDRSWVVGDTWTISPRMVNQGSFGLTRNVDDFPINLNSAPNIPVPNLFGFGILSAPYGDIRGQSRNVPVPEIRDTLTWTEKKHSLQFGADIKPIRVHSTNVNDVNFDDLGLQSQITSLNPSLRPADISTNSGLQTIWDNSFTTILGRYASVSSQYDYNVAGSAFPQFVPAIRDFHYNEYEFFVQDSWKVRSDLTLIYGLRWNYHSVPFEANGFESVPNLFEQQMFNARQLAAQGGVNGFTASPFVTYGLGGPVNHGPGYYHPDWRDFSPRVGFAYSPSVTTGLLGKLLGDRKTSIRAGAGLSYDRVLSTLSFEIDEVSELFATSASQPFGVAGNPVQSLLTDPRFTSINTPPPPVPPGIPGTTSTTIPRPYTPFVTTSNGTNCPINQFVPSGQPCATGLFDNEDLFQLNDNLKMPYSVTVSFGFQRELPKNFMLEVSYFGRFGRRLLGTGDPAQQLNFVDPASGQSLNTAFGNVQAALCGASGPSSCNNDNPNFGVIGAIPAQPWFENQMTASLERNYGINCPAAFNAGLNCTNLAAGLFPNNFATGDLSTVDVDLYDGGYIAANTGLPYQTGSISNVGNFASSNYNSLIVDLRKKLSDNLYFDFDYAYAHSIDNVSDITNDAIFSDFNGQGLICDLRDLLTCRGDSDFDARHTISANYEYLLPIGRGHALLGNIPGWADRIIGGWGTSGIYTFHTGYPFPTVTNAFPINFTQLGPAILLGPSSAVKEHPHVEPTASGQPGLQLFANQSISNPAASNAFGFPFGGDTGTRNQLHGLGYSNIDMALLKNIKVTERFDLQFRAEAFNAFNHPSFNNPNNGSALSGSAGGINFSNVNINSPTTYGFLTSMANLPREMSLGLQLRF
jgi:hypothetical protein